MATRNIISVTWGQYIFSVNGVKYPCIVGKCTLDGTLAINDQVYLPETFRNSLGEYIHENGILTISGIWEKPPYVILNQIGVDQTLIDGTSHIYFEVNRGNNYLYPTITYRNLSQQYELAYYSSDGTSNHHTRCGVSAILYDENTSFLIGRGGSGYAITLTEETDNSVNPNPCGVIVTNNSPMMADFIPQYVTNGQTFQYVYGQTWTDISGAFTPVSSDGDPFDGGGISTGGVGGDGSFDGTSIPVDIPGLPQLSAVNTGFIKLYKPTLTQLRALANYLWSSAFDLDTFKKLFSDPMNAILGLSIVPVTPSGTSVVNAVIGNVDTGVSLNACDSQYVELDCGTINVNEYWGAYLDYSPYTKAEIYLPYIGTHAIDIDDIMGKSVKVVYHIDVLSGACCAYIKCGDSVLYSFIGQCGSSIPITGDNWTNVINGVLNIAGATGTMIATGGATAPMAVGTIASTAVNSLKPQIEKSGSLSGTGGMLGIQTPYLILTRPRQCLPEKQNNFIGYPSYVTMTLGDLTGFTIVDSIHLENISATGDELAEIESILKSGVIF